MGTRWTLIWADLNVFFTMAAQTDTGVGMEGVCGCVWGGGDLEAGSALSVTSKRIATALPAACVVIV